MKLKLRLSMSRLMGGDYNVPFMLTVQDVDAAVRVIDARMSPEQFADLLSNRTVECDADVSTENVGTVRETKRVVVPVIDGYGRTNDRLKLAREAFKPFEVDGWVGDVDDMFNQHRIKNGMADVTFRRNVSKAVPNG